MYFLNLSAVVNHTTLKKEGRETRGRHQIERSPFFLAVLSHFCFSLPCGQRQGYLQWIPKRPIGFFMIYS